MPVMIKALGYYSHKAAGGLRKAKDHLKYLEHGKRRHEFKPRGFDEGREHVNRREFMEQLRRQPERGVIAHKLVFSLSQDERDRLGISLKTLVRDTMKAWSRHLGRSLGWIGFHHEDKGHPHVHVVVAGYADGKQVGLYERDLGRIREWSERAKERQVERSDVLPVRSLPLQMEIGRVLELLRPPRERGRGIDLER